MCVISIPEACDISFGNDDSVYNGVVVTVSQNKISGWLCLFNFSIISVHI